MKEVKLNIKRTTPEEALKGLTEKGWNDYTDKDILKTAPMKSGDELVIFNIGKYVTRDELEKEYESRGLEPADIYALFQYCKENPDFEEKYLATFWEDNGKKCFACCDLWSGERGVGVFSRNWNSKTKTSQSLDTLTDEIAIEHLKKNGYKITKEY